jgi:uncharacterized protein (DUF58 family)
LLGRFSLVLLGASLIAVPLIRHPAPPWIAATLLALWAISLWSGRSLGRIKVGSLNSGILRQGDSTLLHLPLTQPSWPPLIGVEVSGKTRGIQIRGTGLEVQRSHWLHLPLPVRALHRGRVEQVSLQWVCQSPFGLLRHRYEIRLKTDLLVLPRPHALRDLLHSDFLGRPKPAEESLQRNTAQGEFYALREFRLGDAERLVHPRRSARLGQKVLRILHGADSEELLVIFDTRLPGWPSRGGQRVFEDAIRWLAGLLERLLTEHRPFALFVPGHSQEPLRLPGRGLEPYLAALAEVQPQYTPRVAADNAHSPAAARAGLPLPTLGGRPLFVHFGVLDESQLPADTLAVAVQSHLYQELLQIDLAEHAHT